MSCRIPALAALLVAVFPSLPAAQPEESIELTAEEKALVEAALASGETIEISGESRTETSPPGTAEVDREELHTMAGSRGDAISAVRNLPGIANADAYDGGGVLAIRGTSGEDSIVLIDGVRVPLVMHFGNVQSVIPTEMIERLELQPGGFDVENGRATGGVLSVVTRASYPTSWSGFTELSFINASGFVEGPLSAKHGLTMAASFRRSVIDALLPALIPEDAPLTFRTPPRYYDGQLRLNWLSGSHEISTWLIASDDRASLNVEAVDPLDPVVTGDIAGRESFWRAAARWRYESGDIENTATISYGRDHREQTLNNNQLFYRLEPATFYARDSLRWQLHPRLRLRAGSDLEVIRGRVAAHITLPSGEGANDPILTDDPLIDYDEPTHDTRPAGWLALDVSPTTSIVVTPQLRVDHYTRGSSTEVQPRISTALDFSSRFKLRAAVGAHARPLQLAEQLRDDLEPERALHFTTGLESRIADGVQLTTTGFVTELSRLVVRDASFMGENALDAYSNSGSGRVIGAEVLLRLQRQNLSGWVAYTASRSTRVDADDMERRLFDYDQPHNLVVTGSYKRGKWRFGARFRLASGTPTTPIIGSVYDSDDNFYRAIHGERNSERTELDHQLDLRVDRRFNAGGIVIDAFLDVSNAYANAKHLGYEYNFDYSERQQITDVPLLPSFGVRGTY